LDTEEYYLSDWRIYTRACGTRVNTNLIIHTCI